MPFMAKATTCKCRTSKEVALDSVCRLLPLSYQVFCLALPTGALSRMSSHLSEALPSGVTCPSSAWAVAAGRLGRGRGRV